MTSTYCYAAFAAFCLGSFEIPYKMTNNELSPFAVNILYGFQLIISGFIFHHIFPDQNGEAYKWNFNLKQEWIWALLSVSIQCLGVNALLKGLTQDDVIVSTYFAIISSQTLFSTWESLLLLGETDKVEMWKIVLGTIGIICSSLLMINGMKSKTEESTNLLQY
jgi:hypothetical protein